MESEKKTAHVLKLHLVSDKIGSCFEEESEKKKVVRFFFLDLTKQNCFATRIKISVD